MRNIQLIPTTSYLILPRRFYHLNFSHHIVTHETLSAAPFLTDSGSLGKSQLTRWSRCVSPCWDDIDSVNYFTLFRSSSSQRRHPIVKLSTTMDQEIAMVMQAWLTKRTILSTQRTCHKQYGLSNNKIQWHLRETTNEIYPNFFHLHYLSKCGR